MLHACTEDQFVEQPAVGLFSELDWIAGSALAKVFSASPTVTPQSA
jgi:hypothetical protein